MLNLGIDLDFPNMKENTSVEMNAFSIIIITYIHSILNKQHNSLLSYLF